MTRGLIVPLTPKQRVHRALYLAGKLPIDQLDDHVRKLGAPRWCPPIYYRLQRQPDEPEDFPPYNGGTDPTAPDPADRWSKPGKTFINVTCDCTGAGSWCQGHDRRLLGRLRASVGYKGYLNTNSKIRDATIPLEPGEERCYEVAGSEWSHPRGRPEPGTTIVCASGSPGHKVGHEGIVVAYHGAEWDPTARECWDLIAVVDVSSVGAGRRANLLRTGRGWFGTGAYFLRFVAAP